MVLTDTKLLLKVQESIDEPMKHKWIHLCYVDSEVYKAFIELIGPEEYINKYLSLWCREDFGVDLNMNVLEDLNALRGLIKEHYKNSYPKVYRDSTTDRQGWTRIWVTEKMREAVENSGKESE